MASSYRPLFKLDSGGMAEVYVAEVEAEDGVKKQVAIKRILPGLLSDERFVRMFLDEARLSLFFNHSNIVSVFDIGKTDNTYFIVMEYVEGSTLRTLMQFARDKGRKISVGVTIWVLNEVLKGLDYAHNLSDPGTGEALQIVHRDISPPNILLSWNGDVKLTDFGLAKATNQLETTDPGVVKGKFGYLSPEAAWGREVDRRTDIFAVGILAFEMLAGRRLFFGDSDWKTIEMVREAQVPNLREINPSVTPELEAVIMRALAADPAQRYQSCNQMADDLLEVLFRTGERASAAELAKTLEELRKDGQGDAMAVSTGSANLILQMMLDELGQFQSIDRSNSSEPASASATGAAPLSMIFEGTFTDDDETPEQETESNTKGKSKGRKTSSLPGGMRPKTNPNASTPPIATSRIPSPAPKPERLISPILLGVLIAGLGIGAAIAYFFLLK